MLQDGLYEQIVNNAIDAELAAIDKHIETTAIDSSEAPKALVQYIAETARQAFESLRDQRDSLDKQIALANRIVHAIAEGIDAQHEEELSITPDAKQLLALYDRQNSVLALNNRTQIVRPDTSIAQSSLFTGAIHEPQMYTELKK